MFENYKALVDNTCMDVAITAHLLHHRGRPTVTHILAGLSQLRCRGRTSALQQLLATATAWSARNQLPAADPLAVASTLVVALFESFEEISETSALTARTRSRLAHAFLQSPVTSVKSLMVLSTLSRPTLASAVAHLEIHGVLKGEVIRGERHLISEAYLRYFETLLPLPVARHRLIPANGIQPSTVESPFQRIYDPFGFRDNRGALDRPGRFD